MPAKQQQEPISEKVEVIRISPIHTPNKFKEVVAANTNSTKATTTATTITSDYEDFIKSEKYFGEGSLFVKYGFFEGYLAIK